LTPLPAALGGTDLVAWRIDRERYAETWDSGEGAFLYGGRWNNKGVRAVYCAIDPATALLEVAVHVTFPMIDTVPHVLTAVKIIDPAAVHVVQPPDIPDPAWLHPGVETPAQRAYGDDLLAEHGIIVLPSVVSTESWNLIFDPEAASYEKVSQRPLVIDPRLHPAGQP